MKTMIQNKNISNFSNEYINDKKQNNDILEAFNNTSVGTIHSSKSCDQGVDIRGLSVGIILSTDSSKIRKTQRNGRICRFEEGKTAELFTLVIRGTQEWN